MVSWIVGSKVGWLDGSKVGNCDGDGDFNGEEVGICDGFCEGDQVAWCDDIPLEKRLERIMIINNVFVQFACLPSHGTINTMVQAFLIMKMTNLREAHLQK